MYLSESRSLDSLVEPRAVERRRIFILARAFVHWYVKDHPAPTFKTMCSCSGPEISTSFATNSRSGGQFSQQVKLVLYGSKVNAGSVIWEEGGLGCECPGPPGGGREGDLKDESRYKRSFGRDGENLTYGRCRWNGKIYIYTRDDEEIASDSFDENRRASTASVSGFGDKNLRISLRERDREGGRE
ncbi:hypothetical protein P691DRAFT_791326 [Macrolepiota fuliginosa MF-IS2]|uniref:Uncharacterized protein n=1 Tax=Macrolepiota fuliginosa MF-IS2 TaxID=1400762 RepID=A0A9P6BV85_9AGAR|nr:hypothetical protein P691DRAFT_791326 [Macrolepiota fuliginosa MF-IS2]